MDERERFKRDELVREVYERWISERGLREMN